MEINLSPLSVGLVVEGIGEVIETKKISLLIIFFDFLFFEFYFVFGGVEVMCGDFWAFTGISLPV